MNAMDKAEMDFITGFSILKARMNECAVKHGFWETEEDKSLATKIALMHSELSEALEAYRHGEPMSDVVSNCTQVEEEMADLIIRVFDAAHHFDWNLAGTIIEKMKYNETRPYKHGKQL